MDVKDQLRAKANELPLRPGVYIMKNADGKVIYVGKSKALRNRVSQYFMRGQSRGDKTEKMVAQVRDFDYVLTDTEIEALALENKLIKLYTPKYNIKLKDGKSYPYIVLERRGEEVPRVSVSRSRKKDGAKYFGPFSGVRTAYGIYDALKRVLALPSCRHRFPADKGKVKPCIYSQIGQCCAPCREDFGEDETKELYERISAFLRGNVGQTKTYLRRQMQFCSDHLHFEAAALYRDRLKALEKLYDRQKAVGAPGEDFDIVAFHEDENSACMCAMYIRDGSIFDTEYMMIGAETILDGEAVCSLLTELYGRREDPPEEVCLDRRIDEEELGGLSAYLSSIGKKVRFHTPERGSKKQLCDLARDNARQHAEGQKKAESKAARGLFQLASLLGMEVYPERIEAVDISNFGNEEITAGFVSFENGEPAKKNYRLYKMREVTHQDDYASMREAVKRRVAHRDDMPLPDLLLVDGGKGQVSVVKDLLGKEGVYLPVYGMVKDEFHKTRELTDGENAISIAGEQAVFLLIYKIQEEVHRFTYGATLKSKRKTLKRSVLEEIPGIGPAKAKALLQMRGGLPALKKAEISEIAALEGVGEKDAEKVYNYFHVKMGETI